MITAVGTSVLLDVTLDGALREISAMILNNPLHHEGECDAT